MHPPSGRPSASPYPRITAPGRELRALGFGDDPIARPLTYPGRLPSGSGLLVDGCFLGLHADHLCPSSGGSAARTGAPPGRWILDTSAVPPQIFGGPEVPLDDALRSCGGPLMADRRPVLAVGSNASPAQIVRKLAGRTRVVVPMTYARVDGLVAGASAHVSRPGYVPAVPVLEPGASTELVVLWLDDEQLAAVDATEPNYHRTRLPASAAVSLPGLGRLRACDLYAGRHGCLIDQGGAPIRPAGQPELLARLLATSPGLSPLTGARTPEEFVARTRSASELRDAIRRLWRRERRVLAQPELPAGPTATP
ncbi:hypothetical protein GCM10023196_071500 [Actinoallomurus vinaceus]|uniref:Uncharacterized protein n=1 Tax=Actinoallomurus vinaceus TaxID=1080074 RepID=A0ABP8UKE8_9ACTN